MARMIQLEAIGMLKSYTIYVNPLHVRAVQQVADDVCRVLWVEPQQPPLDVRGDVRHVVALLDGAMT